MYQNISISPVSLSSFSKRIDGKIILQNLLIIIGTLSIVFAIFFLAVFGWFRYEGQRLDNESNSFVQGIVPQISERLDAEFLYAHTNEAFRDVTSKEELKKFLVTASEELGPYKYYEGSEGTSRVFFNPTGRTVAAEYLSKVHYKNGPAYIILTLVKENETWLIHGFRIESPVFSVFQESTPKVEEEESDILESLPSEVITETTI